MRVWGAEFFRVPQLTKPHKHRHVPQFTKPHKCDNSLWGLVSCGTRERAPPNLLRRGVVVEDDSQLRLIL